MGSIALDGGNRSKDPTSGSQCAVRSMGRGRELSAVLQKLSEKYVQVISSASLGRGATGSLPSEQHATM